MKMAESLVALYIYIYIYIDTFTEEREYKRK